MKKCRDWFDQTRWRTIVGRPGPLSGIGPRLTGAMAQLVSHLLCSWCRVGASFTPDEVAALLNVPADTISKWHKEGSGPPGYQKHKESITGGPT
jgi:hypothetical protein